MNVVFSSGSSAFCRFEAVPPCFTIVTGEGCSEEGPATEGGTSGCMRWVVWLHDGGCMAVGVGLYGCMMPGETPPGTAGRGGPPPWVWGNLTSCSHPRLGASLAKSNPCRSQKGWNSAPNLAMPAWN